MLITSLKIENYKSLRSVLLDPSGLTVLVGANGSGKSNLADSLDFISEIYKHGLEVAIARKGGYENIAHHKKRRSKRGVSVDVTSIYNWRIEHGIRASKGSAYKIKTRHHFDFVTKGSSITAEFRVVRELINVSFELNGGWQQLLALSRLGNKIDFQRATETQLDEIGVISEISSGLRNLYLGFDFIEPLVKEESAVPETELIANTIGRWRGVLSEFVRGMSEIKVFQISPTMSRDFGVPTPNPELARTGSNLPAVVDLIQKRYSTNWAQILQTMRKVLPGLEDIEVGYNTSRTLSLFFRESNTGRPWNVNEISDGTIQTLAILIAIFDPRSSALVIEEPENSVHPWVIRNILAACTEAAALKQILITTHSPIVVNYVQPEQVWVIWRAGGESKLSRITDLEPKFMEMWQTGRVATFDFIDSGAIPQTIPPSPAID